MTKAAMITICGRPNVGKSTLTNALVGEKVAIVSPKPQTTRNRITAIVERGDTQFVLLDTPGIHKPRTRLGDYMVNVVRESVADVDCVVMMVEPVASIGPQEEALLQRLRETQSPAILAINKIDSVEKGRLLEVIALYSDAYDFDAVIPISAKTGDGLEELLREMEKYAVEGPHFFPDDMITDQPERQICAELVREKLLKCLDKEIPHGTAVEITRFSEREDGVVEIDLRKTGWTTLKRDVFEAGAGSVADIALPLHAPFIPDGAPVYLASASAVKSAYPYAKPKESDFEPAVPVSVSVSFSAAVSVSSAGLWNSRSSARVRWGTSFSWSSMVPRIRVPSAVRAGSPVFCPAVSSLSPLIKGLASQSAKFANQPLPISARRGKHRMFRILSSCQKTIRPPVSFSRISRQSSRAPPAMFQ